MMEHTWVKKGKPTKNHWECASCGASGGMSDYVAVDAPLWGAFFKENEDDLAVIQLSDDCVEAGQTMASAREQSYLDTF